MSDIVGRPWRCDVTGNPYGTDTWAIGYSCECQGCRAGAEIADLSRRLAEARMGQMMSVEQLRLWREADHEDAITLHRNCVIKILDEIGRLAEAGRENERLKGLLLVANAKYGKHMSADFQQEISSAALATTPPPGRYRVIRYASANAATTAPAAPSRNQTTVPGDQ